MKRSGDSRQALFRPTDFSIDCNCLDLLLSHLCLEAHWLVVDYLREYCPVLGFSREYCCLQTRLYEYCFLVDSLCKDCCLVVCLLEVKAFAPPPSYFSCLIKLHGSIICLTQSYKARITFALSSNCCSILPPCSYPMLQH